MHIKSVHLTAFRRFSDLTITGLPESARLVVIAGPNGTGKSSVFDAFRMWLFYHAFQNYGDQDRLYYLKADLPSVAWGHLVTVDFHEDLPTDLTERKKVFYIRSAYRHEADFSLTQLQRSGSPLDRPPVSKLIDPDRTVSANYQGLVSLALDGVFSGEYDVLNVAALREHFIGEVRSSMQRVFDDLVLRTPGDPLRDGSFYFEKGASKHFHYKNLSGGEKAAFDLLLDLTVKRRTFDNTVFCIDEPETHINTKVQSRLLEELVRLVPEGSQLWVATHSIGMMAKARHLQEVDPAAVAFVDFGGQDFDRPVTLSPITANREFWRSTLEVALGDLASLVAPRRVVLCEGRPVAVGGTSKAEFDASCYRTIFAAEYPDVAFISVGSQSEVTDDRLGIATAIETVVSGTTVTRVVDRDDRTDEEVDELRRQGIRVLSRRHLEAYLMDEEVLARLCEAVNQPDKLEDVLAAKSRAIRQEVLDRGRPEDDVKAAVGNFYVAVRSILRLTRHGNTKDAFLRHTLAPLIVPGSEVYAALQRDVLGE